ncbi:FAD-dependent oxidoreductase [Brevibacterium permense]|uniref:NAD(P)/FAD-dependent oxidoreductase n=1 Tax=Brevibacterium permense TaxID=234834 RepID=UPI0021CF14CD|nr:FAD-dependent oxidoreductase [Brevibacterium permense]MCU4298790.1 FAD-dependent oxidoreductase [Brevibacterium permense]
MDSRIVTIGAGQAGLTASVSLRESGWTGPITLVGEENHSPYQRPPLSKGYLSGAEGDDTLTLKSDAALERADIAVVLGKQAIAIDRHQQHVILEDGTTVPYDFLILATGSSVRELSIPGNDLEGIHYVRTVGDADELRADFELGGDTVFIGGGFLNLEIAVQAQRVGHVTIAEVGSQILGRVVSQETANALADRHREQGMEILTGVEVAEICGEHGRVAGITLKSGENFPTRRVVVSIGSVARTNLAETAGLEVDRGILVDKNLRTSDPRIFAIGDCAKYPNRYAGIDMRVESVQNAADHGRFLATVLTGACKDGYCSVPWFWSTQGDMKLQIAGISMASDESRIVEQTDTGRLVVERYREGRLVAVETVNAPGPHMKARHALAAGMVSA